MTVASMKAGIKVLPCKLINSTSSLATLSKSSFFPTLNIFLSFINIDSAYNSSSSVKISPLKYNFSLSLIKSLL